jgi:hypothetical protein
MYHLRDELRAARQEADGLQEELGCTQKQLSSSAQQGEELHAELAWTKDQLQVGWGVVVGFPPQTTLCVASTSLAPAWSSLRTKLHTWAANPSYSVIPHD